MRVINKQSETPWHSLPKLYTVHTYTGLPSTRTRTRTCSYTKSTQKNNQNLRYIHIHTNCKKRHIFIGYTFPQFHNQSGACYHMWHTGIPAHLSYICLYRNRQTHVQCMRSPKPIPRRTHIHHIYVCIYPDNWNTHYGKCIHTTRTVRPTQSCYNVIQSCKHTQTGRGCHRHTHAC